MATNSAIEWTDATWNPTTGCDRISPGCAHCYAKDMHDRRHKAFQAGKQIIPLYAKPFEELQLHEHKLDLPLRWREPRMVFVNSTSDLFHEDVPDEFIDRVFAVMARATWHTFQVLTKRPERMLEYLRHAQEFELSTRVVPMPLSNVWLGVSVENQRFADERIPLLLQTPAAVRFISAEPLLGPLRLEHLFAAHFEDPKDDATLDWVIVGGESGPGARPFDVAWARSIVQQCQAAGVPVFVKQGNGLRPGTPTGDPSLDQLKEFPSV